MEIYPSILVVFVFPEKIAAIFCTLSVMFLLSSDKIDRDSKKYYQVLVPQTTAVDCRR